MSEVHANVQGTKVELSGHLEDSTELDHLYGVLQSVKEISLARIYSVSWLGLQRFLTFLQQYNQEFCFVDVPLGIYRVLLLFPELTDPLQVKSFQVEIDSESGLQVQTVNMDDLILLGQKQGRFAVLDFGRIVGSLHHLCRPFFGNAQFPEYNAKNPWSKEHEKEFMFWYEYASFCRIITESCALAQRATVVLVEESLQRILLRILNAQQAYKVINPDFKESRSRELLSLMPLVQELNKSTLTLILDHRKFYDKIIYDMEKFLLSEFESGSMFYEIVKNLCNYSIELEKIASKIEQVGVDIGEKVFAFGDIFNLKKCFDSVVPDCLNEKTISSVRRKFKLENTDSSSWNDTLQDIHKEFRILQEDMNRCIVAMQGFDLVRQVFEHRINEAKIIKDAFETMEKDWESLKRSVISTVQSKLVTDQEKYAFKFFFPDEDNPYDAKLNPGEAAFFF